jgi:hypothetical protein
MPLSIIFQLYRGGQFYWWSKSDYLEKTYVFRQNKLPEFQIFGIDPKVFIDIFGQS